MSSSSDSATSPTTSTFFRLNRRAGARRAWRPSLSAGTSPGRDACSAGATPNSDAGAHREQQREQQHAPIDRRTRARAAARPAAAAPPGTPATTAQARATPAAPPIDDEQHALGQQLPDDAPAAGAERQADRHLAAPRRGLRQQQVRDVRARDQQHGAHDAAEQQRRPSASAAADWRSPSSSSAPNALQRADGRRRLERAAAARADEVDATLSSSARACSSVRAGLQPADREQPAVVRVLQQVRVLLARDTRRAAAA